MNNSAQEITHEGPSMVNGIKASELKDLVTRIENLSQRKQDISDDITAVYKDAKNDGFDVKTIRAIIKLRKMDKATIEQEELLLEVYARALGMS